MSKRRKEAEKNLFALPPELASIVSCPGDVFPAVLKGLGLVVAEKDPETGAPTLWRYGRKRQANDSKPATRRRPDGQSDKPSRRKSSDKKPRRGSDRGSGPGRRQKQADPDSPFAALAALIPAETPKKKKPKPPKAEKPAPDPDKSPDQSIAEPEKLSTGPAPSAPETPGTGDTSPKEPSD